MVFLAGGFQVVCKEIFHGNGGDKHDNGGDGIIRCLGFENLLDGFYDDVDAGNDDDYRD